MGRGLCFSLLLRVLPVACLLLTSGCIVVVPRNEELSTRLRDWKILAERGNAEAQYNFGWYLIQSATRPEDEREALSWFDKSARAGVAEAQFALATMLDQGKGVEQREPAQARYWYLQAAEAGLAVAQYNLGVVYARGEEVTRDDEEAFQWFFLSAIQDYLPARKTLRTITKRMSAEQRVRARQKVKEFLGKFDQAQKEREGKVYEPPTQGGEGGDDDGGGSREGEGGEREGGG